MQVPQLQIRTTDAKIGLTTTRAKQEIEQRPATMSIEQPKAIQEIRTTPAQLKIDTSEARAQYGFKTISQLSRENAQEGQQAALEGIGRRAQQGRALMSIENGGNPIANQAKQSWPQMKRSGIKFIPSHGSVKIDYTPAKVNISHEAQKPIIDVQGNKPVHRYTPGSVSVELLQKPTIEISL